MSLLFKENHDPSAEPSDRSRGGLTPFLFGSLILAAGVFSFLFFATGVKKAEGPALEAKETDVKTVEVRVKENDTFYTILSSFGSTPEEITMAARRAKNIRDLTTIREGDVIKITTVEGRARTVEYRYDVFEGMRIRFDPLSEERVAVERFEIQRSVEETVRGGTIETSLYSAAVSAGIPLEVVMELSDVFAWEVDFSTETQKGDAFSVLFETVYADGAPVGTGKVLGAEIVNNGKKYLAVYYEDKNGGRGYYDSEGWSLRRTLLKSPLRYRRITSYFSGRRYHPVLRRYTPHHGVDYAAPAGTPVEAAGDGKVVFAGWKRGYGNFIVIKHNSDYSTAYGHLSRIKSGIKAGRKVEQGEVIGYVGSTGLSTGPHLHYEVRVRGSLVNPLAIKSAPKKKLAEPELRAFLLRKNQIAAKLGDAMIASNR